MAVLSVVGCRFGLEAQHDGAAVRLAVTALVPPKQQVHQGAAGHLVQARQIWGVCGEGTAVSPGPRGAQR